MNVIKRIFAVLLSLAICFSMCTVRPLALTDDPDGVYDALRDGFYRFSESIDISEFGIMPEELSSVLATVLKDDPYLFFVDGQMSYSFIPGGKVLAVKPQYIFSGEEAFKAWDICRAQVRSLAQSAQQFTGDLEKALYLHDAICLAYEYDNTLESDNMYSFFLSGRGTCQSYTHAYMAALRECGIESHYVASDSIEHIWNYVKLDGEWYHVDLTWDDSSAETAGVSRRHFLCSDRVATERGHKDWYSSVAVTCLSERFAGVDFDELSAVSHLSLDADHDGSIGMSDLLLVRYYIANGAAKKICIACADGDGDGCLSEHDTALVRKKLLGID